MSETREHRLDRQAEFGMTQSEKDEYDRLAEAQWRADIAHREAHQALIDKAYANLPSSEPINEVWWLP
ncbi:hypothetical protein [Collimonas fungivorans]|uniref:hypothetical protein n=1 Tax=Collimonas fungivorans TaxID=158899 RepID=UPI0005A1051C|nr:hypothetical protein [Collimonas fungivorans]